MPLEDGWIVECVDGKVKVSPMTWVVKVDDEYWSWFDADDDEPGRYGLSSNRDDACQFWAKDRAQIVAMAMQSFYSQVARVVRARWAE